MIFIHTKASRILDAKKNTLSIVGRFMRSFVITLFGVFFEEPGRRQYFRPFDLNCGKIRVACYQDIHFLQNCRHKNRQILFVPYFRAFLRVDPFRRIGEEKRESLNKPVQEIVFLRGLSPNNRLQLVQHVGRKNDRMSLRNRVNQTEHLRGRKNKDGNQDVRINHYSHYAYPTFPDEPRPPDQRHPVRLSDRAFQPHLQTPPAYF